MGEVANNPNIYNHWMGAGKEPRTCRRDYNGVWRYDERDLGGVIQSKICGGRHDEDSITDVTPQMLHYIHETDGRRCIWMPSQPRATFP